MEKGKRGSLSHYPSPPLLSADERSDHAIEHQDAKDCDKERGERHGVTLNARPIASYHHFAFLIASQNVGNCCSHEVLGRCGSEYQTQ